MSISKRTTKVTVLVWEAALALLLNVTGGLLGQHAAIELARWGWFVFLTNLSYVIVSSAYSRAISGKLKAWCGNTIFNLVAVVGSIAVMYGYWTVIDAFFSHYFPSELKVNFKYSKSFTSVRKARVRKEMNAVRSYLVHVGFEVPIEGPTLSYWDENAPPAKPGTLRSWGMGVGDSFLDDPVAIRTQYARFAFRRLFKVLEFSDEELTQMLTTPISPDAGDVNVKKHQKRYGV